MTEQNGFEDLNDQQRLALYKLGDHIKEEHLKEFGKEAVIVDGISWHVWEKKDDKGKVVDHGMKPKIGVQFPGMPKIYEYRIPATTLKELEADLGPAHLSKENWVGARIKFLAKNDGFQWVDATVIATAPGSAISDAEADEVIMILEEESAVKKGGKK
jgi:hypothetical protein